MDKNAKQTILEVIKYLLDMRHDILVSEIMKQKPYSLERAKAMASYHLNTMAYLNGDFGSELDDGIDLSVLAEMDDKLIKLNNLLSSKTRVKEVLDIEQHMKKIQVKKYITRKEFAEMYNISISSQDVYRGRLYDPLPYHQKVAGGKVVYVVEEVEKWFANQHK